MPEGDTIHRLAAALGRELVGRQLVEVRLRAAAEALPEAPALVVDVGARGKFLLLHLAEGWSFCTHLGLRGDVRRYPPGVVPRGTAPVLVLRRDDGWAFCWREPAKVHLCRRAFLSSYPPLARLGPDLVADGESEEALWSEVAARLAAVEPAQLIGGVLLQQSVACGIGNVYKCEVLFLESINPWLRLGEVGMEGALALYRRARPLLRANLRPGPRRTRQGAGPGLWVYDRAGQPCLHCRHPIAVARQGRSQRPTYWCPSCQNDSSRSDAGVGFLVRGGR